MLSFSKIEQQRSYGYLRYKKTFITIVLILFLKVW